MGALERADKLIAAQVTTREISKEEYCEKTKEAIKIVSSKNKINGGK